MPHLPKNRISTNLAPWIGRFAPSPSGALHLGSLVAAVASYMIAKQKGGQWLVRIEDIDPPREVAGASSAILTSLEDFGLFWDGEVTYQSQRKSLYQQRLAELIDKKFVYQCECSRKEIETRGNKGYDGFCKLRALVPQQQRVTRIKFGAGFEQFNDRLIGQCRFESSFDKQDFIVKRRGGLFAYQLAVVADDIEQGINHVVRGQDILDSTPRQNFLYHCFDMTPPEYYHLPLVKWANGDKLSKQTGALAIDKQRATKLLLKVMIHLGQPVDDSMVSAKPTEIISYYQKNWQISYLAGKI